MSFVEVQSNSKRFLYHALAGHLRVVCLKWLYNVYHHHSKTSCAEALLRSDIAIIYLAKSGRYLICLTKSSLTKVLILN